MNTKLIKNLLCSIATIGVFSFVTNVSAAAPAGTCGLVASIPHVDFNFLTYAGVAKTKNLDLLAEINFTTRNINYSMVQWVWDGSTQSKRTIGGRATFTITGPNLSASNPAYAAGTPTPNSYQISFTPTGLGGDQLVTLNVLPVNSGNTYLIQGIDNKMSGVCQAF